MMTLGFRIETTKKAISECKSRGYKEGVQSGKDALYGLNEAKTMLESRLKDYKTWKVNCPDDLKERGIDVDQRIKEIEDILELSESLTKGENNGE